MEDRHMLRCLIALVIILTKLVQIGAKFVTFGWALARHGFLRVSSDKTMQIRPAVL